MERPSAFFRRSAALVLASLPPTRRRRSSCLEICVQMCVQTCVQTDGQTWVQTWVQTCVQTDGQTWVQTWVQTCAATCGRHVLGCVLERLSSRWFESMCIGTGHWALGTGQHHPWTSPNTHPRKPIFLFQSVDNALASSLKWETLDPSSLVTVHPRAYARIRTHARTHARTRTHARMSSLVLTHICRHTSRKTGQHTS